MNSPQKKTTRKKTIATKKPDNKSFNNEQLQLFQSFFTATNTKNQFSNTIELWDATPKFTVTKRRQSRMREGVFLPSMEHRFKHRGMFFNVRLDPARIKVKDEYIEFFPSYSEELIEDVLRKFASDQQLGMGYLDNDRSGVRFSIYLIKKELKARGHTRSYTEIYDSLMILSGCHITITSEDSEELCASGILNSLAGISKRTSEKNPKAFWYADFSPLVTVAIRSHNYRQINFYKSMSFSTQLAQWFYKRLCHNFVQASFLNNYKITFSTISRDSLLLFDSRKNQQVLRVDNALTELVNNHVLNDFEKNITRGARNSIAEIEYVLQPHSDFIKDVKAANARAKNIRKTLKP